MLFLPSGRREAAEPGLGAAAAPSRGQVAPGRARGAPLGRICLWGGSPSPGGAPRVWGWEPRGEGILSVGGLRARRPGAGSRPAAETCSRGVCAAVFKVLYGSEVVSVSFLFFSA